MRGAGQEVEAVAVGGARGGEAQGRHSGGVSCEPLRDQQRRHLSRLQIFNLITMRAGSQLYFLIVNNHCPE